VFGLPTPAAAINREAHRKERVMNSTVIDSARGVNRIDAFLNNQQAGLCEVNPAELQAVEGGLFFLAIGMAFICGASVAGIVGVLASR
jgi:hypothetical protein